MDLGEDTHVTFKPQLAQVIAAVERGEPLVPIRDKVIERARFALKRVGTAHQAAEEAAKRAEQEVWRLDKGSAAIVTCGLTPSARRTL